MTAFELYRPTSLPEALRLGAELEGARYLGGGTDLMVRIREGKQRPKALVSLGRIAELEGLSVGETTRIGAGTRVAALLESPALAELFPALVQAAGRLGSVQIRNLATAGGNLCNASPCADLAPPLLVAEARLEVAGPAGRREVPLADFFTAPGTTRLGPGELLCAIHVPRPRSGTRACFLKHGRVAMDIALASLAVAVELDGETVTQARLAAGSVAPRPVRLPRTEALLAGQRLTPELLARVKAEASAEVQPISDVRAGADFRRHMIGVLLGRALAALLGAQKDGRSA